MNWKRTTWVALLLLAATPSLQATPLPPGATDVTPDSATLDNTVLLGTTTVTYALPGGATATLTNEARSSTVAYKGLPAGALLFTYRLTNTGTVPITPLSLVTRPFTTLTIDVSSLDFAGFTQADRSAGTGELITFTNFAPGGSGGANTLDVGETSTLLVIRTSALGDVGLIGSTTLNGNPGSGATFAPLAVVPEPTTFALAAVGLPLAGLLGLRRWRRKPPT